MGDMCAVRIVTSRKQMPELEKHISDLVWLNENKLKEPIDWETIEIKKLWEIVNFDLNERPDGLLVFEFAECNHGIWEERNEAALAGCIFFGDHSPGHTYQPCRFAAYGREMDEAEEYVHNEGTTYYVIRVTEDLEVLEEDLDQIKNYQKLFERAKKQLLEEAKK
jgi:hypothetical protein